MVPQLGSPGEKATGAGTNPSKAS